MSSARWLLALSLIYGVAGGGLAQPAAAAATRPLAVAPDNFAEATLTLNEAFFNTVLDAVFRDFPAPSYSIAGAQPVALPDLPDSHQAAHALPQCASVVSLARSVGAAHTAVRLGEGRIAAPLCQVQSCYLALPALAIARGVDADSPAHLHKVTKTV